MIPPLLHKNKNFRRYFIGQSVSLLGDQVSLIALPLTAVLALHATPGQMGALTTAYLIPNLLFSLHAGAWVDRRGRRRQTMLATDVLRGLFIATIPIAYAFGELTLAAALHRRVRNRLAQRLLLRGVRRVLPGRRRRARTTCRRTR